MVLFYFRPTIKDGYTAKRTVDINRHDFRPIAAWIISFHVSSLITNPIVVA